MVHTATVVQCTGDASVNTTLTIQTPRSSLPIYNKNRAANTITATVPIIMIGSHCL